MIRSKLLNRQGNSASILIWLMYGAVCALLGMCLSGWASIQKQSDGLIYAEEWLSHGTTLSNDFYPESGTWVTSNNYLTTPNNGVLVYKDQKDSLLPQDFVYIQRFFAAANYYIYARYQDSNNYYRIWLNKVDSAYSRIVVDEYISGTPTTRCMSSNYIHNNAAKIVKIVFNGGNIDISIGDSWLSNGNTLCSVTTGSYIGTGKFKFVGIDSTGIIYDSIWTLSNILIVQNVPNNDYAMICDSANNQIVSIQKTGGNGNVSLDMSSYIWPINGYIKVSTSNSCTIGIIDDFRTFSIYGGDVYAEYNGEYLTHGPWLGAPYQNGSNLDLKIGFRFKDATQIPKIQWKLSSSSWPDSSCASQCISGSTLLSSEDYTGYITLSGLSGSTTYNYRIYAGSNIQSSGEGTFTTPVMNGVDSVINVALFSCQSAEKRRYILYDQFKTLKGKKPSLTIITGDYIYEAHSPILSAPRWEPIVRSAIDDYWIKYKDVRSEQDVQQYSKDHFSIAMWDDHESCNDLSGGSGAYICDNDGTHTYSDASFSNAKQAFKNYIANVNPPSGVAGELYFQYRIGNVEFFVTDNITYRSVTTMADGISKTMLGSSQKTWFKNALLNSTATTKVWVSTKAIRYNRNNDTWGPGYCSPSSCVNATYPGYITERDELRNYRKNNVSGVWSILSGDSHISFLAKHTDIDTNGEYELQISGLGFPSPTDAMGSGDILEIASKQNAFGWISYDTTFTPDVVDYSAYNEANDKVIGISKGQVLPLQVMNSTFQQKIACNSVGICVVTYWDRTNQLLCLSNSIGGISYKSNCAIILNSLDASGSDNGSALAINGNTVYLVYATPSVGLDAIVRTATISGSSITINNDSHIIYDGNSTIYPTRVNIIRDSIGYIHICFSVFDSSRNYYKLYTIRSVSIDDISVFGSLILHNIALTPNRGHFVNIGNGKLLLINWLQTSLNYDYYDGSIWGIDNPFVDNTLNNYSVRGDGGDNGGGIVYQSSTGNFGLRFTRFASCAVSVNSPTEISPDSNTKGLWHMNNSNVDSSACASNITWIGNPSYVGGYFNNAIALLRINSQRGTLAYNTCNDLTSNPRSFTIDGWIYKTETVATNDYAIFSQKDGTGVGRTIVGIMYTMCGNSNKIGSAFLTGTAHCSVGAVSDNQWYHIGMVYEYTSSTNCSFKFYINGYLDSILNISNCPDENATGNYVVGSHKNEASQFFNGYIDDLQWSSGVRPDSYFMDRAISNHSTCTKYSFDVDTANIAYNPFMVYSNQIYYVGYVLDNSYKVLRYKSVNNTPLSSGDFQLDQNFNLMPGFNKGRMVTDIYLKGRFTAFFEHGESINESLSSYTSVSINETKIPPNPQYINKIMKSNGRISE